MTAQRALVVLTGCLVIVGVIGLFALIPAFRGSESNSQALQQSATEIALLQAQPRLDIAAVARLVGDPQQDLPEVGNEMISELFEKVLDLSEGNPGMGYSELMNMALATPISRRIPPTPIDIVIEVTNSGQLEAQNVHIVTRWIGEATVIGVDTIADWVSEDDSTNDPNRAEVLVTSVSIDEKITVTIRYTAPEEAVYTVELCLPERYEYAQDPYIEAFSLLSPTSLLPDMPVFVVKLGGIASSQAEIEVAGSGTVRWQRRDLPLNLVGEALWQFTGTANYWSFPGTTGAKALCRVTESP